MLIPQSCPTLCDPGDCSPPGSSVHGILQARILGWVAILSSSDLPDSGTKPGPPAFQAESLLLEPRPREAVLGSPSEGTKEANLQSLR